MAGITQEFESPNHFSIPKLIGVLFVAWATLTLTWTANLWDGLGELINLTIIGMILLYGSRMNSSAMERVFIGLSVGITVSSLILLIPQLHQLNNYSIVQVYPHGLFGNRNMLAEIAVMTALGCFCYKRYWFIPGLVPAIFWYPQSRGALLAGLAGASVWCWTQSRRTFWLLCLSVFVAGTAAYLVGYRQQFTSFSERIEVWQTVWRGLTVSGRGLGSLYTLSPYFSTVWDTTLQRVDHAHNEALEIWFELGIPGLVLYGATIAISIVSLYKTRSEISPVFIAFLVISMVAFPWHIPTNAFVGALVLGYAVRSWPPVRDSYAAWRSSVRHWYGLSKQAIGRQRRLHAAGGMV